ncbi:MAG TPA: enoyl-CoA hydratase/isomerase family protein [Candidatus Deferrimicrobium sp.]|nr:enoyl-CoA hydratase/isomerase family protein [Candidatus Deferrimicrobium sp.]
MKIEEFQDIKYEKEENGIVTITLNVPSRKNAMSQVTFLELWYAIDAMEKDKETKVMIITGAGDAFSSGGYFDMKILETIPLEIKQQIDLADIAQKKLCLKFWNFDKPVIAAINGLAVGAGFTMALTCADLIYMAEDAWVGLYFVKRAIVPEFATTWLLPFLVGFQKAKELIYFGDQITAQQVLALGLVNKVLPKEQLLPYAREQALRLIPPKGPSLALKWMKKTLHQPLIDIVSNALDMENKGLNKTATSGDFRESLKALKEKRDSVFKGK